LISFIHRVFGHASPPPWDSLKSVREKLFSLERLEEHARNLALAQRVTSKSIKRLVDNYHLVEKQFREVLNGSSQASQFSTKGDTRQ
jgi:hypothetical protein